MMMMFVMTKKKKIFGRFCHFLAAAIDFFQYQIDVTLSSTLHTEVRQMTKLLSFDRNEKKFIDNFRLVFYAWNVTFIF